MARRILLTLLTATAGPLLCACGPSETHRLPPEQLGMTENVTPLNADGENPLYEVRLPVQLPVKEPSSAAREELQGTTGPFPSRPWVLANDIEVSVAWTLINLDDDTHEVEILVDPWNEFGRYWPGLQVIDAQDGEVLPNLSGINIRRELPGVKDALGRDSRIHGVFTFDDMKELAVDFATVINIMENPPASASEEGGGPSIEELVNHTFHVENRRGSTPLTDGMTPEVIPALVGFDMGLRATEPVNVAIEFTVEIRDHDTGKIVDDDDDDPLLPEPENYYQLGT